MTMSDAVDGPAPEAGKPAASPVALAGELNAYREAILAARSDAETLTHSLTDAAFNWRPESGRWSVGQCLDHLNHTLGPLLPSLETAVEQARRKGLTAQGPSRYGWLNRWFVRAMDPANTRKMRAPRPYLPAANLSCREVIQQFLLLQDRLIRCIESSEGLDLVRIKAASPALGALRLSLGTWFAATAAHERRHLRQARAVLEHDRFPRP